MKKFMKIVLGFIGGIIVLFAILIGISVVTANNQASTDSQATISAPAPSDTTSSDSTSSDSTSTNTSGDGQSAGEDTLLQGMLSAVPAPTMTDDGIQKTVTYVLTNDTKLTFDYVELNVDFYNKAGVKIDSEMVNTTNVTPGQKFQLQVNCMDETATSYKVSGIYSNALHQ